MAWTSWVEGLSMFLVLIVECSALWVVLGVGGLARVLMILWIFSRRMV